MSLFYTVIIALSGGYLIAQTIAWIFFGKSFFPDSGTLFENKADKNLWQTVFPKNMLRLVITVFAAAVCGILMNISIKEGWITLPLAAVGGITVNFVISRVFSPMYFKLHKSGEPTEKELSGMRGTVSETITTTGFGVISVKHGSRGFLFRAVSANGRRLPKGTPVTVIYAQDSCCFVESDERLFDVLFEEDSEKNREYTEKNKKST